MLETLSHILLLIAFAAFAAKRGLTYMHAYQQEEYDSPRFAQWIRDNRVFDKRLSAFIIFAAFIAPLVNPVLLNFVIATGMAAAAYFEKDPRKDSKKKLAETARAKRIYLPALLLSIITAFWCFESAGFVWLWLINIHLIPVFIMLVNKALQPYENKVQQRFWQEAHDKVLALRPVIIGITGSFGKTSVKHILGHILKNHAATLMTPGSVNTPMGITRIIREELQVHHKYLVIEMGAYGPGSIARLCKLTPPDLGIITAIGHAHYERFKSLETVARTKFELAEAVIAKNGVMVIGENTLAHEPARQIYQARLANFVVCGQGPASLRIEKVIQHPEGLEIRIEYAGAPYVLITPLFGLHHGTNVALAFAAALQLGLSPEDIKTALKSLSQIAHRLEVKPQANGTTIIDDAYNSNPAGFQAALELLGTLGQGGGRKILITPGIVELGAAHTEEHEKIGTLAGQICDIALVVQAGRIPSFIKGFQAAGPQRVLEKVENFAAAQNWLAVHSRPGDIILIENDLPDIYERIPRL